MNILFSASDENWAEYKGPLQTRLPEANLGRAIAPDAVDYIVYAPSSKLQDFTDYTTCQAVLNLWAGVEEIAPNPTLTQPLVRMVDPGMTAGMVEWVVGHVMRHHLGMDAHINNPDHVWAPVAPPLANDRWVSILGLGELGAACAKTLSGLGFQVHGWARSPKDIEGVTWHGDMEDALDGADIAVLLVPLTDDTENSLNAFMLDQLAPGAVVINPGRGPLIDDNALLAALDSGHISHATLDVFRVEPLPKDHPYWGHPRVTVTPHIASTTRVATACDRIAENIARIEAGQTPIGLVDRARGY